jgi:hypothetical protein
VAVAYLTGSLYSESRLGITSSFAVPAGIGAIVSNAVAVENEDPYLKL